ncbi:MAG: chain length determinant protein tyrosine kinase EpsG [Propionivibrio sp.]
MNRMHAPLLPALGEAPVDPSFGRSIGAILIDAGRLSPADAESILRFQKQHGSRFGDAAIELGLLSREDIRFALAHQFDYPCLPAGDPRSGLGSGLDSLPDPSLVAAYRPDARIVEQLRGLRSQLMLRWFEAARAGRALAVVGTGRYEGRSFIAANLAVVFSQLGERTLLIDADLRAPAQHRLFRLDTRPGLSERLSGRAGDGVIVRIPGLRALSVLPAGALPPNPQELLGRAAFGELLRTACRDYDVVLIDTPAVGEYADALTLAARAGGALLVARQDRSSLSAFASLATGLGKTCAVVGSVLNDVRR